MPDVINYHHYVHPHTKAVLGGQARPTKTNDHRVRGKSGFAGLNARPDFGASFASSQVDEGAAGTFSPYA